MINPSINTMKGYASHNIKNRIIRQYYIMHNGYFITESWTLNTIVVHTA